MPVAAARRIAAPLCGLGPGVGAEERRLRAALDDAAAALGSVLDDGQRPAADALAAVGARIARRRPWPVRRPGRGIYLHGDVGRGKTWLATAMLAALRDADGTVLRLHAFDAARRLHAAVARAAGHPNALRHALGSVLGSSRVLFLDELHAHDPGDAMILSRLVREALGRGMTLVATSNYGPRGLLPNPRHHHLVRPLVQAIEDCCDVVELAAGEDYRRRGAATDRSGWMAGMWAVPGVSAQAAAAGVTTPEPGDRAHLSLRARVLPALAVEGDAVHLHFAELCESRTSVGDLLDLVDRFATVVLWSVPRFTATTPDAAQRFADLVDVCWDRDTRLVVLAEAEPEDVLGTALRDRARISSRLAALPRG